jgi:carbonic anhydrase
MSRQSAIDETVASAAKYAQQFSAGGLPRVPSKGLAVVTCMDARIDLYALLGLVPGDAHVIRNAGGVVGEGELRSLAVSQRLLGTSEIAVILHTDCGMRTFHDEDFKDQIEAETGLRPQWTAAEFGDVTDDVRRFVKTITADPFLPHRDHVRGFVYDVHTGQLTEVR